jgi:hypothetical protein
MTPTNTSTMGIPQTVISLVENRKCIENHIKAAIQHEEAAKKHYEAAKYHEEGDHEKASEATAKAQSHHAIAGAHQRKNVKQYIMIKELF